MRYLVFFLISLILVMGSQVNSELKIAPGESTISQSHKTFIKTGDLTLSLSKFPRLNLENQNFFDSSMKLENDNLVVRGEVIDQSPTNINPLHVQNTPNPSLTSLEQSTHNQVNEYRRSLNLPPLELDIRISEQARLHSQAMASGKYPFSHQGFEQRVEAIASTISYRSAAENVAYNQGYTDPVTVAVKGWIDSPGHQKNMVGNFNLTGIGIAKNAQNEYYFTQIFILQP